MSATIHRIPSPAASGTTTPSKPYASIALAQLRVDSRVIAANLQIHHKNVIELIDRYASSFAALGVVPFQTEKPVAGSRGGRPELYVLLSEDQCYFLLTLSRNSEHVVNLRLRLVIAFRDARSRQALHDGVYLPSYHALHDEVSEMARRAHEAGSKADECVFHCNVNKLANKVCGLAPGQRGRLSPAQRAILTATQEIIRASLRRSRDVGHDHSTAYQVAKDAAAAFASASRLALEG